jgi:CBS domain containing-hemolysin-like protein
MVHQSGDRIEVDARFELRRLAGILDIEWDPTERGRSLNGLLTERLGRLPRVGDTIEWQGHRIEVLLASERHADKVALRKL